MMDRRAFLSTLGLLAAPLIAEAQTRKDYRIGFLGLSSAEDYALSVQAFRQRLREQGYEEREEHLD